MTPGIYFGKVLLTEQEYYRRRAYLCIEAWGWVGGVLACVYLYHVIPLPLLVIIGSFVALFTPDWSLLVKPYADYVSAWNRDNTGWDD